MKFAPPKRALGLRALLSLATLAFILAPVGLRGTDPTGAATGILVLAADTVPTPEEIVGWLAPDGDQERAVEGIRTLIAHRPAYEATLWVHLLSVLDRIDPAAGPVAAQAVALADAGRAGEGVDRIVAEAGALLPADRGTLLALAALLAEASDPTRAAELRERVMAEAPEVLEFPELALRHARWLLSMDARRAEGFRLVEEIIVERPNHPIAPEARRLLQLERAREPR